MEPKIKIDTEEINQLKRIQESDFIHPEPISAEKRAILKGFFLKDK